MTHETNGNTQVLRKISGGRMIFCPGCQCGHVINLEPGSNGVGGRKPCWTFNGDERHPTFEPSLLVTYPYGDPPEIRRCHSFIRNGQIQFLSDCTHELAGKAVPLEPF